MPRFAPSKDKYEYLKQIIPRFMRDSLADREADKRLLLMSSGSYDAQTEAVYMKALESLGYEIHVATAYDPFIKDIFSLFGISRIYFYDDYFSRIPLNKLRSEAENIIDGSNEQDILELSQNGIMTGKYAASSVMRQTRKSSFDLKDELLRSLIIRQLAQSSLAAESAENILGDIRPDLIWVNDRGYSPVGQIFDLCMKRNIPAIQRCGSHKSGYEILKRYSAPGMGSIHHHSLSAESWEHIKNMPWNEALWQEVYKELESTYKSGDWFSEVGTQFNKTLYNKEDLISKLSLDPSKKTAVIYPHMFWDATFFWGKDLFRDYYDWYVAVIKTAADNDNLNWVIKIHPANIVKARRDNYSGGHGELKAVYDTLGKVPGHIKVIEPESDINTFSLFQIMDYCLTVRGTIGIESAAMGINTLTAGTGRYDGLGFTHDFDSKTAYMECIRALEQVPPMTEKAVELARRYAYGVFMLRPIHLDLLEHGYKQDEKGTMVFRPLFKNRGEFEESDFVQGLRDFVRSGSEDYINSFHNVT